MSKKNPPGRLLRLLPWAAALIGLVALLYSMDILSRSIGFYWDEIWDYIPSVALIRGDSVSGNQEIRLFDHPVPLVSGPYQGALKTWIVAPLIKLFGTSPHTILTLNVFFAGICLLGVCWALFPLIGRWAWVIFLWPLLDANFLLTAPMDYGPSLFQCIFVSLAIGALFRYLSNFELKYYRWVWFFSGCILAQKLTAIPVVISLIAITAIFSCASIRESAGKRLSPAAINSYGIVPLLLFLLPMIPHLLYFWKTGFSDLFSMTADANRTPYFSSLVQNFRYFRTMFDGSDWYRRITLGDSAPVEFPPVLFISGLLVMSASVAVYFSSRKGRKHGMPSVAAVGFLALSFLLYPAFRGLSRPWHFFILAPIFACAFIASSANCLTCLKDRWRETAVYSRSLFAVCVILWTGFSAAHGFGMLRRIENKKGVCLTSPAITDVYNALRAANIKRIYGVNYSIAFPVYVLSKGTIRADELAWTDLTGGKIDELLNAVKASSEVAIVYRFCGCEGGDPAWIRWLNHEPQISDLIKRVDSERGALDIRTISDERATDFVLIRKPSQNPPSSY